MNLIIRSARDVIARKGRVKKGTKFFRRSLWRFKSSVDWLRFVDAYYAQYGFEQPPIDMMTKLGKSYGGKHLPVAEIVRRLKTHYTCLAECFVLEAVLQLLREEAIVVGTLQGKSGRNYSIQLQHNVLFQQEGELTLSLYDHTNHCHLQYLTFSFARLANHAPFIWIGCLQGARVEEAKELIIKATKDLHGLRPKTVMLESIYMVMEFMNAAELRAIAKHNHPFAGSRKKKIFADYDSFWEEAGGVRNRDKNFLLPKTRLRRLLEDVPSHKRKDWLKRQGYINLLQTEMRDKLYSLASLAFLEQSEAWPSMDTSFNAQGHPTDIAKDEISHAGLALWIKELFSSLIPKPAFSLSATLALGLIIGTYPAWAGVHKNAASYEDSDQ